MTIENLKYRFDGGKPTKGATAIVGVLGSGNLEVLVEPAKLNGACEIEVSTAARGFGTIWQAVMKDFFARHRAGDIRISVNDAGATPAIVSLRLDQAIETYSSKGPSGKVNGLKPQAQQKKNPKTQNKPDPKTGQEQQ